MSQEASHNSEVTIEPSWFMKPPEVGAGREFHHPNLGESPSSFADQDIELLLLGICKAIAHGIER
jgi:hypothetical protein